MIVENMEEKPIMVGQKVEFTYEVSLLNLYVK